MKQIVGLSTYSRSSPLLQSAGLTTVSDSLDRASVGLFKKCLFSKSVARDFYEKLLFSDEKSSNKHLVGRVRNIAEKHEISLFDILCDHNCKSNFKHEQNIKLGSNGLVDSINYLLFYDFNHTKRNLVSMLLNVF